MSRKSTTTPAATREPKHRRTELEKATEALRVADRKAGRLVVALRAAEAAVQKLTEEVVEAQALVAYLSSHPALATVTDEAPIDDDPPLDQ